MVLSLATCENGNSTSQAASGYLDQAGDDAVEVAVDLSGGWPVELVRGAAYLYDGEITKGKEAAAVLTTLHKDVYEDHLENAMADGNQKEADGGVYYTYYENEKGYLTALNDAVFVRITADKENIEAVVARISLYPAN